VKVWFFYILRQKEHQIFGIRAIIEAIQAGRQSLYSKKRVALMKDLMKVMKRANVNFFL
jgi:23S rRNA (guanosine2251-2'-O)-methyltransferase